jgi:glycosyltransferase involved in cell wall biosynthesis
MKVLIVSNIPFPYIVDSFNELGKYCELTILFLRKNARDRNKLWLSDNILNFKAVYLKGIKFGSENILCFSVLNWLRPKKFDIICFDCYSRATSILGIEYMNLIKAPFIIIADGGFIKKDGIISKRIKRHLIGSAKYWISTGDYADNYLINYGAIKSKIHQYLFTSLKENDLIKHPVTLQEKDNIKFKLGIKERKIILSVGRFIKLKRFDILIKSAKELPNDYGVYIVGGEPTSEYLNIINEYKIKNVHFIDFKPKDQLKEYFKAADLFVLPTSSDVWGLVINEAMANALPVITTDMCIAGLELVRDFENGFIVPVGNENSLSEKMTLILNDEKLHFRMAISSLNKIQNYTIEKMAIRQIEIFNTISSHN